MQLRGCVHRDPLYLLVSRPRHGRTSAAPRASLRCAPIAMPCSFPLDLSEGDPDPSKLYNRDVIDVCACVARAPVGAMPCLALPCLALPCLALPAKAHTLTSAVRPPSYASARLPGGLALQLPGLQPRLHHLGLHNGVCRAALRGAQARAGHADGVSCPSLRYS
jgi:hypothetical protein